MRMNCCYKRKETNGISLHKGGDAFDCAKKTRKKTLLISAKIKSAQ